jgi:hypothetical protein
VRSEVDEATLVPDPGKTIEAGAVLPWNSGRRRLSMYAAGGAGVRLGVPYKVAHDHDLDLLAAAGYLIDMGPGGAGTAALAAPDPGVQP